MISAIFVGHFDLHVRLNYYHFAVDVTVLCRVDFYFNFHDNETFPLDEWCTAQLKAVGRTQTIVTRFPATPA